MLFSQIKKCSFCIKMFFSQIRSHAQKCFSKVQKNGTDEYLPPLSPYRKKLHTLHPVLTHYTLHPRNTERKSEEIERFVAIEEKLENLFSIKKCITVLEG